MSAHVWQPYPFGGLSLLQCSHCQVMADSAASVRSLPEECPREPPRLPHIIRVRPVPYGKKAPQPSCMCCVLPTRPEDFRWQCGNGVYREQDVKI